MANLEKKQLEAINSAKHLVNLSNLSFSTKRDYKRILSEATKILHTNNFHISSIYQLKQKHIACLVDNYKEKGINNRSIKNKLSSLRFVCRAMKKFNLVLKNEAYDLPERKIQVSHRAIFDINVNEFESPYVRYAVELQKAFGLRREEAIKFNACDADKGDYILLKSSWTKGGIERDIPVISKDQRDLLEKIKAEYPNQSLIPKGSSYIQQRKRYDQAVSKSNYTNLHGLRHAYAQTRYKELSGSLSPKQGGKFYRNMNDYEKRIDREAREIISSELGHSRIQITKIYLG